MVKIGYTDISLFNENDLNFNDFPTNRILYINSIKDRNRKIQSIVSWKLLNKIISSSGIVSISHVDFQIDNNGRWYDKNNLIHFSLSHSENICAVFVSDTNECGIDVEMISDKILRLKSRLSEYNKSLPLKNALTLKWTEIESEYKLKEKGLFSSEKVVDSLGNEYYITLCANTSYKNFSYIKF